MKLSIIIPTYNVEKYLERCLYSCVAQNVIHRDYEIIVVNDGSTDNSLNIAKRFAENHNNVYVISQENGGLSSARNSGLKISQGEYVWFVDSDDWIVENCLSTILSKCQDVDVLCLSYYKFFENGALTKSITPLTPENKDGQSLFITRSFCTPAQFYIYKRQFLIDNKLFFYEGIFHEDMEFTPRMLYKASIIDIYSTPVYYYYIRSNSIMTTVNPKKSFDLLKVAKSLSSFCEKIKESDVKKTFDYYISISLNNALYLTKQYTKEDNKDLSKSLARNKNLFKHLRRSPLLKNKLEGILFTFFPNKCISIYSLIQKVNFKL